ncbi:MAG: hypothetical protein GY926_27010 [bacterium]|nr:hypothetical protein [bacterium]MCP4968865.1 hypothetical protein [bacterium]
MKTSLIVILALLAAACSSDPSEPTVTAPLLEPATVTSLWLEAVMAGDVEAVADLVEPTGLAVVAGVENSISSNELVGLLNGGFTEDLATGYWTTFRDDFASIRGGTLESLVVGEEMPITGKPDYTSVAVSLDDTTGLVVLRRSESGWRVDHAATVGPALVDQLSDYLESALSGDNAIPIADAYRTVVIPALDAAIVLDESNSDLVFGNEFMRQLVEG